MQAGTRVCTAHVKMSGCARACVSFFFRLPVTVSSLLLTPPLYNKTTTKLVWRERHRHTHTQARMHELRCFDIQFK